MAHSSSATPAWQPANPPLSWWRRQSLARQFAAASSMVLLAGMVVIGLWVTARIENEVTRNTAAATALYVNSLFAPLLQELAAHDRLSPETALKVRATLAETPLGQRILSFKVWKDGGLIAFSTRPSTIGRRFPVTEDLERAWNGEIAAEFDSLLDEENVLERAAGLPLLEMYSPIRDHRTGRIIAVAEAYETAADLKRALAVVNLESWLVVAAVTASMLGLLAGIVMRGSRVIDSQQHTLQSRVSELSQLLAQNEELRVRVQRAAQRTAEINERYLRRIGADLHDGPAQLLALAALRLEAIKGPQPRLSEGSRADMDVVRESLTEAMAEIRDICAGLFLPDLEGQAPAEVLRHAAQTHERRTLTQVRLDLEQMPDDLPEYVKISLYRIVQEALTNAFRHAGGLGQAVVARYDGRLLEVAVSDTGPGFDLAHDREARHRIGLAGLAERVRVLGGDLRIDSAPREGTRLVASFVLGPDQNGRR